MRILALDPAAKCGWAYRPRTDAPIVSGTWDLSTRRDESAGMKLIRLEAKLNEIAELGIDLVVYETPALHTYPLALVSHAKLIGVIEKWTVDRQFDSKGYAPKLIKKFITGNGNAKKADVVRDVKKLFGIDSIDDNEADAIALLELARSEYGEVKHGPV